MFRAALGGAAVRARGRALAARAGRRVAVGQAGLAAAGALAAASAGGAVLQARAASSWGEAGAEGRPEYSRAPSGLGWHDVEEGAGAAPRAGEMIRCHYTGTLADGKVFDSSYGRRPLSFKVGARQVIPGWDEGILGDGGELPPMKAGGKRQLEIPSGLAYGERGAGGVIPPGATLYFDVELLASRGPLG